MLHIKRFLVVLMLVVVGGLIWYFSGSFEEKIDYNTQVKPIFNKKCISCHGGVKAKANFSLLFREDALKAAKSGRYPIVPGHPGKSEMIRRITEKDEEERMPYKHDPLTTDHGRGDINKKEWTDHGSGVADAYEIWFAVMGPNISPLGEQKNNVQLFQDQFAQTIAKLLGVTYKAAHPVSPEIKSVIK